MNRIQLLNNIGKVSNLFNNTSSATLSNSNGLININILIILILILKKDPTNNCNAQAIGECSHAEGSNTIANGFGSHAEGCNSIANGDCSHAEGRETTANGTASHSEGSLTQANGEVSHAEGLGNIASGKAAHAEGGGTNIVGDLPNEASGDSSHAEGLNTKASGIAAHAEGTSNQAIGQSSHVEGAVNQSIGVGSHAEGNGTKASGNFSHTEGIVTEAVGLAAHAEGAGAKAIGGVSHAEGESTLASGNVSHAEGFFTTASGGASHAEGNSTIASGAFSHAEGNTTQAIGDTSHAEGFNTQAQADFSHAEGQNTVVNALHIGSHIMGQNGTTRFPFSWHLANGLAVGPTLNSAVIEGATGNLYLDGTVLAGSQADYAEMFETVDGNSIDFGYFVTLEEDRIRKATANDDYILGVVSANPAMIADASDLRWHNLFVKDEWGKVQYHEVVVPEVKDGDGKVIQPSFIKTEPILNPEWDSSKEYIPRLQRAEWVPVGLVGKLLVRDDGTAQVNSYCKPNNEGIATASNTGYRVIKRTGPNQILVLVK